jgi:hypothetical protein
VIAYYLLIYHDYGEGSLSYKIGLFGLSKSVFITQCTTFAGGTKIASTEIELLSCSWNLG